MLSSFHAPFKESAFLKHQMTLPLRLSTIASLKASCNISGAENWGKLCTKDLEKQRSVRCRDTATANFTQITMWRYLYMRRSISYTS
jgi:hypothetical protein